VLTKGFSNNDALVALLTAESLVFAVLAVAVAFSVPGNRIPNLRLPAWGVGYLAAGFVSIIAFGALMAWWSIFVKSWPHGFRGGAVAVALAMAIVGQPLLAWTIAPGLRAKK
jgi:hypothetical protein